MVVWASMSLEALADEALLSLLTQKGDVAEDALRVLYRRYAGSVLALARRMGLDEASREDCVQEVFERIWKGAASYDPRKTQARSWLLAVAHHRVVDQVRRRAARPQALEPDAEHEEDAFDLPGPGLNEAGTLDRIRIHKAMKVLDEGERTVIEALFFKGYVHTEAAEVLGIPLGTVKTRAKRALEKLREVLGEQ
jgi:RNA polymerase sigma-70 factor (ECF subfamily)